MKKPLLIGVAAVVFLLAVASFLLFRTPPPRQFPDAEFSASIPIAPLAEALTFARTTVDGQIQLLAVTEYGDNQVAAVNITHVLDQRWDDPIDLFRKVGYEALAELVESERVDAVVTVAVADLIMPLELADSHVAAGTNFAAHAQEADVVDGPFLFAKLVTPTPSGSSVEAGDALLDYEVELAFVTISDVRLPDVPEFVGLILTNDFTDRATLMRHLNPDDVTSGEGFTTGKSAEGYLPVGDLFVVPRDLREFVAATQIQLAVNGQLRQSAPMSQAIWDIDELLRQIQARANTRWVHHGEEVGLPVNGRILPERTLILSGTPDGTAFAGISNRDVGLGVVRWATGGWGDSFTDNVIERYIAGPIEDRGFLQADDQVLIRADRLGTVKTVVE